MSTNCSTRFYKAMAADEEADWFTGAFSNRSIPEDIPAVRVALGTAGVLEVLSACMPGESKAALRRLVDQVGVRLNQARVGSITAPIVFREGDVLKAGKTRWFRLAAD